MSKTAKHASVSRPEDAERFDKAARNFTAANTKTPELAVKVLVDIGALNSKGELKRSMK